MTGDDLLELYTQQCARSGHKPWPITPPARRSATKLARDKAPQVEAAVRAYGQHLAANRPDQRFYVTRPYNFFGLKSAWMNWIPEPDEPAQDKASDQPDKRQWSPRPSAWVDVPSVVEARERLAQRRTEAQKNLPAINQRATALIKERPGLPWLRAFELARREICS